VPGCLKGPLPTLKVKKEEDDLPLLYYQAGKYKTGSEPEKGRKDTVTSSLSKGYNPMPSSLWEIPELGR